MTSMNIKCCLSDQTFSPYVPRIKNPYSLTKSIQLFAIRWELIDFRIVV